MASVALAVVVSSVSIPGVAAAQRDLPAAEQPALPGLTIIAPAAPGGGWDQLAREMQREIERQALLARRSSSAGSLGG